jgi:hypothetical protein
MPYLAGEDSKRTRVEPVFRWLRTHGGPNWPGELIRLAGGIEPIEPGPLRRLALGPEATIPPSPERLAWMIRNAHRLAPWDGRAWREYRHRVLENPGREEALATLARGESSIPKDLVLEGPTHADCLIECEGCVISVEGKRNDWLGAGTKWDISRDQLARNAEAAWLWAGRCGAAEFRLLICHEHELKHHEQALLDGYRTGSWSAGWPHLSQQTRNHLAARIGTLRWNVIVHRWPAMAKESELSDVV